MAWERKLDHAGFALHCASFDDPALAGLTPAFRVFAKRGAGVRVGFAPGLCRVSVELRDKRTAAIGAQVLLDVFACRQCSDRGIRLCVRDRWFFRSMGIRLRLHHDAMVCMGVCAKRRCGRDRSRRHKKVKTYADVGLSILININYESVTHGSAVLRRTKREGMKRSGFGRHRILVRRMPLGEYGIAS